MTTYEVLMSQELLDQLRHDVSMLPAGFRLGRVTDGGIGGESPSYRMHFVEVEDDDAPADLAGAVVDLEIVEVDDGDQQRLAIRSRRFVGRRERPNS